MRFYKGTPCMPWPGTVDNGYGVITVKCKKIGAYRAVYENLHGPIASGMCIDHLCRNKICVNPKHLEQVTTKVNVYRGIGPSAQNIKKTRCPLGHRLSGKNLYQHNGRRHCRECRKLRQRKDWQMAVLLVKGKQ